jgi:hypothetical protein
MEKHITQNLTFVTVPFGRRRCHHNGLRIDHFVENVEVMRGQFSASTIIGLNLQSDFETLKQNCQVLIVVCRSLSLGVAPE